MGRFENFTPPTLGSELSTAEITLLEELTALTNSSTGEFIRKVAGSLVNATLAETIALAGLSDVSFSSVAQGDILYYNGSGWVNLAAGTAGLILQTQGSGANPVWASVTGGTVISVSVVTASGISGTVANATTTPAITLTLGDITPSSIALGTGSITMTGSIAATGARVTKGWFTDIETTNALVGNITGSAATVTGAAQAAITSLGTLTTLTVDDITINGNTISSAGASTLAITPTAGQAITFDGTVTLDAGVIAGATSITSTTFVGALTGTASGNLVLGGALGTPSSGTLTNCTGLPVAGLVALTASEIVITTAGGVLASAAVATYPSLTELTYIKGVTSAIQTQLNAKAATLSGTINEIAYFDSATTIASLAVATYPSLTELSYVKGVTSAIQTQLGTKVTSGGALGTPSSGTGINITGIPAANILAGSFGAGAYVISTSLQAATIELGAATDTTLSRVSAGLIAVEGLTIVDVSTAQTLSNKTLTAPRFADLGFIADANGNEILILDTVTSAVNEVTLANAATGTTGPLISASGETNVDIRIAAKGTGAVHITTGMYGDLTADTDGATITFNLATSNIHTVTLGGNRTLALSNEHVGQVFMLRLLQDVTGSRTVTWFTTIKWAGGSAPTLTTTASKADILGFIVTSAGNYDGVVVGANI